MKLATAGVDTVLPVNREAVLLARDLSYQNPALTSRDLIPLTICRIHQIRELKTFDQKLHAAFY
jgi:predicted nucleic acid-binding protein